MRSSLVLGILALGALGLTACTEETTTEPNRAAEPSPTAPELAVASNSWITRAEMPGNRTELATATLKNAAGQSVVYAIGGVIWALPYPGTPLARVTAYNVATNTWTDRQPLPKRLAGTNGAAVLNGKIYVTGGYPDGGMNYPRPTVFMYDPATNTWTQKRNMPTVIGDSGREYPAGGGVTGVIGGTLYVVSGCYLKDPKYGSFGQVCNPLFLRYNLATDRWVILPPPFPEPTYGLVTAPVIGGVIDGKFYVMASTFDPSKGQFAVYDPATNKWAARNPGKGLRYGAASAVLGGKLYVMGGLNPSDVEPRILGETIVYDPVTDAWTRWAAMPSARYGISASKVLLNVNGKARNGIEVIGGMESGDNVQYIP